MTERRPAAARSPAPKPGRAPDHAPVAVPAPSHMAAAKRQTASGLGTLAFSCAMVGVLIYGFMARHDSPIDPKDGVGYWLGVAGSLIMLSLLLYSKRKNSSLQWLGSVMRVFKLHMVLGIIGPVLIALHSGFFLRSTNSTVAVVVMSLVVASGILGRFLYAKLHMGLYGNKASALSVLADAEGLQQSFGEGLDDAAVIMAELNAFTQEVLPEPGSISGSIRQVLLVERQSRARHFRLMVEGEAIIAAQALRQRWSAEDYERRVRLAEQQLDAYFASLKRATKLRIYERVFAFWHLFHVPLFYLLIFTVLAHVFAVHWY
jgi:hypothetical protein